MHDMGPIIDSRLLCQKYGYRWSDSCIIKGFHFRHKPNHRGGQLLLVGLHLPTGCVSCNSSNSSNRSSKPFPHQIHHRTHHISTRLGVPDSLQNSATSNG